MAYEVEPDPFPESDYLKMMFESLYHKAVHDYNKWTARRDKKTTMSYEEAQTALAKYGKRFFGKDK